MNLIISSFTFFPLQIQIRYITHTHTHCWTKRYHTHYILYFYIYQQMYHLSKNKIMLTTLVFIILHYLFSFIKTWHFHDYSPGGAGKKFRTISTCGNFSKQISRTFLNHSSLWFTFKRRHSNPLTFSLHAQDKLPRRRTSELSPHPPW